VGKERKTKRFRKGPPAGGKKGGNCHLPNYWVGEVAGDKKEEKDAKLVNNRTSHKKEC